MEYLTKDFQFIGYVTSFFREESMFEQALYAFTKAASLQPTDANILYEKASLHYELGDLKKVVSLITKNISRFFTQISKRVFF